jgi:hypothetical protein
LIFYEKAGESRRKPRDGGLALSAVSFQLNFFAYYKEVTDKESIRNFPSSMPIILL